MSNGSCTTRPALSALLSLGFILGAGSAHAQFGNLLNSIQKALPPQMQQPQQGQPAVSLPAGASFAAPPARGSGAGATGKPSAVAAPDQWCKHQAGALGNMKPDTGVIASEFRFENLEAVHESFQAALQRRSINRTFPNAQFFQASFETSKVRAIYDLFLAFPEPEALAALIQLTQSRDGQESADASMALAFLHLQAPELSASKDRWWEHVQRASRGEHYTASVFRARMAIYGEYGNRDLNAALSHLNTAGSLKQKYASSEGVRNEFDPQNYQLVQYASVRDIYNSEPPSSPHRRTLASYVQSMNQIEAAQNAYAQRFPSTRLGKIYGQVNQVNAQSISLGTELIRKSQGGNQLAGQLDSLKSLKDNQSGDKRVFVDIDPATQAAQLKMFAKLGGVDEDQKRTLAQAQQLRYTAQGMLAQSYAELLASLLDGFGDMTKMAAPLPALKQANDALIQSCVITSKWEQAMRAKDVPPVDRRKSAAEVAAVTGNYKDE